MSMLQSGLHRNQLPVQPDSATVSEIGLKQAEIPAHIGYYKMHHAENHCHQDQNQNCSGNDPEQVARTEG